MNRRSFMAGLAGLPIVGWGAGMLPKSKAKSEIVVHGPEVIVVHDAYNKPRPTLSLRFENVPLCEDKFVRELLKRLQPLFGTVNRREWHWTQSLPNSEADIIRLEKGTVIVLPDGYDVRPHGGVERAGTLMFTDVGVSPPENGLCSVVCAFTPACDRRPWPGSHRPVDLETQILKALTAGKS